MSTLWLASYPRSGNTLLRMILFQCFGLRSGSVYPKDLWNQTGLQALTGHVELGSDGAALAGQKLKLVKTHERPIDEAPAIYVVRDGRDVVTSLAEFYKGEIALQQAVEGWKFGTWAAHVNAWTPRIRPRTLFLRYEDLATDLQGSIDKIAGYLGLNPSQREIARRDNAAAVAGPWVRPAGHREALSGPLLDRFWELNGSVMHRLGYPSPSG